MNTSRLGSPADAGSPEISPSITVGQLIRLHASRVIDICATVKRHLDLVGNGEVDWYLVCTSLADGKRMLSTARDVADVCHETTKEEWADDEVGPSLPEADPFLPVAAQADEKGGEA